MTITYVLMQNLKRNPLRTMLTAAAFALPMAVFVAAISLVVLLAKVAAANEQELRLGVRQKTSLTNLLPEGMRRKIEAIDGARQVQITIGIEHGDELVGLRVQVILHCELSRKMRAAR